MRLIGFVLVFLAMAQAVSAVETISPKSKRIREVASGDVSYLSDLGVLDSQRPFVVMGDTQRTLEYGRWLGKEVNDLERVQLVDELKASHLAFLVIVGDLVGFSSESSHWKFFDDLFRPLNEQGVPILPALGNHDYLLPLVGRAMKNFEARFLPKNRDRDYRKIEFTDDPKVDSEKKSHFYSRRYGSLGLIWLDTNFSNSSDDWKNQKRWFAKTLEEMESDKTIRGVLVFAHHPPYTNSSIVSDEVGVQRDLLPAFFASKKTIGYVSGHCHNYEHFIEQGKNFIVSGGGGGPRQSLKEGGEAKHKDLFVGHFDGNPKDRVRPFHYLMLTPGPDGVHVDVRAVKKKLPGAPVEKPFLLDQFDLKF